MVLFLGSPLCFIGLLLLSRSGMPVFDFLGVFGFSAAECALYCGLVGIFHLVVLGIIGILCGGLWGVFRQKKYLVFLYNSSIFLYLLLISGACAHTLWSVLVFGRWYVSMDYVVDFYPFFPITQTTLDFQWGEQAGYLIGSIDLIHLQLLWAVFALMTWLLTVIVYKEVKHLWHYPVFQKKMETLT